MKFIVFFLFVFVAVALAAERTKFKKPENKCTFNCEKEGDRPICAQGENRKLNFGNACVLNKYNCENKKSYTKFKDGICKEAGGIRLS